MANKRKQTDYWQIVNIDKDNNEITMVDYVFDHGDGFKGATGSKFEAVSKEEFKERTKKDNVMEYLVEAGLGYAQALDAYKEAKANGVMGLAELMFDLSYKEHWDKIRQHGYPETKYPIFNCIGGGRCFDKDFEGNVNPELATIIREYEK